MIDIPLVVSVKFKKLIMLKYTSSSWFPLYKFRTDKGDCDRDYMLGSTKFHGCKDYLTGETIRTYDTVIWSRKYGVNILLDNYLNVMNTSDISIKEKLSKIGLGCKIKVS